MAKQTEIDRVLIFTKKIIRTQLKGLSKASLRGRITGPRVLANSIPKAGTNMMERALTFIPGMRMAPFRTLMSWDASSSQRITRRLRRLRKGQFINAHLPANETTLGLVDELGIKTLFLIRDPRDVVISHYKYVNEIDTTHYSHDFIASLPDDNARLKAVITGETGVIESAADVWQQYSGWLTDPNTLVIKFEDLIGNQGGGSQELQYGVIDAIAMHLKIKISSSDIEYIAGNVFSKNASTFRKGQIGNWKDIFTDEHVELFKEETGNLLIELGYETSGDWGVLSS